MGLGIGIIWGCAMPSRFTTRKPVTTDLVLDEQNPRFVALDNRDQESIIFYLLKNEGVIDLARSINSYGGLMPGEFPIVCIENGSSIVVEGNRRVCACKVLLNPNLAAAEFRAFVPTISQTTKTAIRRIEVHMVSTRDEAQIVLGTRHIRGIKRWPSVSKFMFFAQHAEAGKTVDQINELTGVAPGTIKVNLRQHYFLQYILSLDCWTELEKQNRVNYTELHKKGVSRILRIFNTEGSSELRLTYDDSFYPNSELPEFGKIVEHIVRRVLNILPGSTEITTRHTFGEIRNDVQEWLPEQAPEPTVTATTQGQAIADQTDETPGSGRSPDVGTRRESRRVQEFYFENLVHGLDTTDQRDEALIVICEQMIKISRGGAFRQYPLAASYLTRALVEQTLKRHLRINDNTAYQRFFRPNRDSSLGGVLRHYCSTPALIPDRGMYRLFGTLFPNGRGIKDTMDLTVHRPDLVMPTGTVLQDWVSQGLKGILEYLLQ